MMDVFLLIARIPYNTVKKYKKKKPYGSKIRSTVHYNIWFDEIFQAVLNIQWNFALRDPTGREIRL